MVARDRATTALAGNMAEATAVQCMYWRKIKHRNQEFDHPRVCVAAIPKFRIRGRNL